MGEETFESLREKVLNWADDRDLLNAESSEKQIGKFAEEANELVWAVSRMEALDETLNEDLESNPPNLGMAMQAEDDVADAFGDVLVTLIISAQLLAMDLTDCLNSAYEEIKDRKGKTTNGVFIKE